MLYSNSSIMIGASYIKPLVRKNINLEIILPIKNDFKNILKFDMACCLFPPINSLKKNNKKGLMIKWITKTYIIRTYNIMQNDFYKIFDICLWLVQISIVQIFKQIF